MRRRWAFLFAWALLIGATATAQAQPLARADLSPLETAVEQELAKTRTTGIEPALGMANTCRSYPLPGYGAVIVVSTRLLPPAMASEGPTPSPSAAALKRSRRHRGSTRPESYDQELALLEAQAAHLQREAEHARVEAELAFEETRRRVQGRLVSGEESGRVAALPHTPPWIFWSRAPEDIVAETRSALVRALATRGAFVRGLQPDEWLSVAVDFAAPAVFLAVEAPERTLMVRVRKRDADARASGRLTEEEFQRRVEVSEY